MNRLLILVPLALSACTPHVRLATPPPELLACPAEPTAPDLPAQAWVDLEASRAVQMTRDLATLAYILDLQLWGGTCSSNLAGVKAWADTVR